MLYKNHKSAKVQLQDGVPELQEAAQELFDTSAAQTCSGLCNRGLRNGPWGTGLHNHGDYNNYPTARLKPFITNAPLFLQIANQNRFVCSLVLQDPTGLGLLGHTLPKGCKSPVRGAPHGQLLRQPRRQSQPSGWACAKYSLSLLFCLSPLNYLFGKTRRQTHNRL